MGCRICGRGSCASWMHSISEQEAWESLEGMDEDALKREVLALRREVAELKAELEVERPADDAACFVDKEEVSARKPPAEHCGIRRTREPDDIISGHVEFETRTLCGEDTCSDECWQSWVFCPYCGKLFDVPAWAVPPENESDAGSVL